MGDTAAVGGGTSTAVAYGGEDWGTVLADLRAKYPTYDDEKLKILYESDEFKNLKWSSLVIPALENMDLSSDSMMILLGALELQLGNARMGTMKEMLKTISDEMKRLNKENLEKIQEIAKKVREMLEKQAEIKKASMIKNIFSAIGAIFGAVAAIAAVVVTGGSSLALAAICIASAVGVVMSMLDLSTAVKAYVGDTSGGDNGNVSLTGLITKFVKEAAEKNPDMFKGTKEEKEKQRAEYIKNATIGMTTVLVALMLSAGGASLFRATGTVAEKFEKIQGLAKGTEALCTGIQCLSEIGEGTCAIADGILKMHAADIQWDKERKEAEKMFMQRLIDLQKMYLTTYNDSFKDIMQELSALWVKISEMVKNFNDSQQNVAHKIV